MRHLRFIVVLLSLFVTSFMMSFSPKDTLLITSTAFTNNGMIPAKYTCNGLDINPPLHVDNIPVKAKSLAIIVHDPNVPVKNGFTHWVVWNIGLSGDIPENFKGAMQGMNSAKKLGYSGMCPPTGTHHYHFTVYALNRELDMDAVSTDRDHLMLAIKAYSIAKGELTGLYKKEKTVQ